MAENQFNEGDRVRIVLTAREQDARYIGKEGVVINPTPDRDGDIEIQIDDVLGILYEKPQNIMLAEFPNVTQELACEDEE